MSPHGYYQSANGPMVTHALEHVVNGYHGLPWGRWQIGNNREGTLSVFLTTYMYIYIYIYVYTYI